MMVESTVPFDRRGRLLSGAPRMLVAQAGLSMYAAEYPAPQAQ
jgi:hypothetical protein